MHAEFEIDNPEERKIRLNIKNIKNSNFAKKFIGNRSKCGPGSNETEILVKNWWDHQNCGARRMAERGVRSTLHQNLENLENLEKSKNYENWI